MPAANLKKYVTHKNKISRNLDQSVPSAHGDAYGDGWRTRTSALRFCYCFDFCPCSLPFLTAAHALRHDRSTGPGVTASKNTLLRCRLRYDMMIPLFLDGRAVARAIFTYRTVRLWILFCAEVSFATTSVHPFGGCNPKAGNESGWWSLNQAATYAPSRASTISASSRHTTTDAYRMGFYLSCFTVRFFISCLARSITCHRCPRRYFSGGRCKEDEVFLDKTGRKPFPGSVCVT